MGENQEKRFREENERVSKKKKGMTTKKKTRFIKSNCERQKEGGTKERRRQKIQIGNGDRGQYEIKKKKRKKKKQIIPK